MKRLVLCLLTTLLLTTACSSSPKKNSPTPAPLPKLTSSAFHMNRSGQAVAEVDASPSDLFERTESFLRKKTEVAFSNASLGRLEGNQGKKTSYVVEITPLTTGKAGITVAAGQGNPKETAPDAAKSLAEDILNFIGK